MKNRCNTEDVVVPSRRSRGKSAEAAGRSAENRVAETYSRRGMGVADQRWRCPAGEIDLIARDGDGLVFVEVKQRRTIAEAAAAIGRRQMDRLCRAAEVYLANAPLGSLTPVRFDVALLDRSGRIELIENAFGAA